MTPVQANIESVSPWPHRIAWLLAGTTFPLIWVGGLVTTYDAGMAVPDWPSTYGYNLFLYPWQTWIAAPWDLFIEHGHRLLGALVGFIAIGLVLATWMSHSRRLIKGWALAALLLVIIQGLLGGQRVLLVNHQIAQVHGVVGPLFFCVCLILVALTSPRWQSRHDRARESQNPHELRRSWIFALWLTFGLAVLQLVLGSHLRHGVAYASADSFAAAVVFHVLMAGALGGHAIGLVWRAGVLPAGVRRGVRFVSLLVLVQIFLGIATWSVKYGWPVILQGVFPQPGFLVQEEGMAQSLTVTAHVAIGSLILGSSCFVAAWAHWCLRASDSPQVSSPATSPDPSLEHACVGGVS